jgi:hypothetical protein
MDAMNCRDCRHALVRDGSGRLVDGNGWAVCSVTGGKHIRAHKGPEELLAEIRHCVKQIKSLDATDPSDGSMCADYGRRLAEAIDSLDAKLSTGDALPRDWRR